MEENNDLSLGLLPLPSLKLLPPSPLPLMELLVLLFYFI